MITLRSTSLKKLDIPDDRLEEMALRCTEGGTSKIGNFVKLGKEDVLNILKNAK